MTAQFWIQELQHIFLESLQHKLSQLYLPCKLMQTVGVHEFSLYLNMVHIDFIPGKGTANFNCQVSFTKFLCLHSFNMVANSQNLHLLCAFFMV